MISNMKDSCAYLNNKICKLINKINRKCEYQDVKNDHYIITCELSHMEYKNLYDFYSKKISIKQFKQNQKNIQKVFNKYKYSCRVLINNFYVNNDKYLIYLNEILIKSKNRTNHFFKNFKKKMIIENKEVIISLYNIYNAIDSEKNICNKEKIYYEFIKKIKLHEKKFKYYFENQIKKNMKNKNYFIDTITNNNINLNCLIKFQQKFNDSNVFEKYIKYKKNKLGIPNLLPIELFSSNYESKYILTRKDFNNIFSIFDDNYIDLITSKLNHSVFINKTTENLGINIGDIYGNSMILFNESNTIEDNYIIIHELGHSIYNHYVDNKLLLFKDVLSSEICAIVNELFLNDYFMKNEIIHSTYFLDSIMKIIMDGIIEQNLSNYIYIKNNINYESIKKEYMRLLKGICKDNLNIDNSDLDIIINNNIYNSVYLLRYLFALIISINIKTKIDEDSNYVNIYQRFIKNSSNTESIDELLSLLDLNLNDESLYDNVINYIKSLIKSK